MNAGIFVLIILFGGGAHSTTVIQQEFSTYDRCMGTKTFITEKIETFNVVRVAGCFPK